MTPAGVGKVEGVVADLINDALGGSGICIDQGTQDLGIVGDLDFCFENDSPCAPGCRADLAIDSVDLIPETGQLRIRAQFDTQVTVPVRLDPPILPPISCDLNVTANNTSVDAIITVGINPGSGKLAVTLQDIPSIDIDPSISGCSIVGAVLNFVAGLVGGIVEDFVIDLLEPQLGELLAGLLPDPLGIENTVDLSGFLNTISPGSRAALETRVVPGGYAFVESGGLSLGIISGINTDSNPATRSAALDSEPARCVPAMPAPDLSGSLTRSPRNNFTLPAAGAFRGSADGSSGDVLVGLSETFLDLAGHHAITSGALCLGIGTELVEQLNVGTLGIVVPSLAELGSPDGLDPVLLVTRPLQALDFDIGDGTEKSPSLTLHVRGLAIDFYAFLFQRYTRAFTVTIDLDVGVNLEFSTDEDGNPQILPVLVGLDAENIDVVIGNAEFLREDTAALAALLPSLIDLALPLLVGVVPEISLPEFLGFRLEELDLSRVTTPADDFLAISATLGASPGLARLSERFPALARSVERLAAPVALRSAARGARLVSTTTPAPEEIRQHLLGRGGAMPEVVIDVPARDAHGRALEWTWNLSGGMWRPFQPGGRLVLRDGAFAIQGRYQIGLRSRAAGDYRTLSTEAETVPVVIDSVGPRIQVEKAAVENGVARVSAFDLVSADRVTLAFGSAGDRSPVTAWGDGSLAVSQAAALAAGTEQIRAWARDELGNQTTALVRLNNLGSEAQADSEGGGCAIGLFGCEAGRGSSSGLGVFGLALVGLAIFIGRGRTRRAARAAARKAGRIAALLLVGGMLAAQPACDCSGGTNRGDDDDGDDADDGDQPDDGSMSPECEMNDDCADECDPGTVPVCEDDTCRCDSDVLWGRIGQYSEMDVAPDGTVWVSAYNSYHGDLMVAGRTEPGRIPDEAWEFVDGVPDGPVLIPGGEIRGGINEPGPDVGLYTDIAVASDGTVMVSYFDASTASLKLAARRGGTWSSTVVEAGTPASGEADFEIAGQYSSITMRGDGRPGIAYFVHLRDGDGERTELRFAEAAVADPGEADWTISALDSAPVPASPDPLRIPAGVGLFANAARLADGSPVVVYYDRINGDLKLVRFDAGASAFDPPEVLAGSTVDVGRYPGLVVSPNDVLHVSYVSASNQDLLYINTQDRVVELIDDGYREIGETEGGVPIPELHFVGDDSALVLAGDGLYVAYQDATSHELLVAHKAPGGWTRQVVAGNQEPFAGGYGFYVSARMDEDTMIMSTWVIDQPNSEAWVELLFDLPPAD